MSRNLHLALRKILIEDLGFRAVLSDGCVYRWEDTHNTNNFLIAVVWVDDAFYFGNTLDTREKIDRVCDKLLERKYKLFID